MHKSVRKTIADIKSLKIQGARNIAKEALKRILEERKHPGYRLIGDILVSEAKLKKIEAGLDTLQEKTWSRAVELIQGEGVGFPDLILRSLGYAIKLHGMDMGKATILKDEG